MKMQLVIKMSLMPNQLIRCHKQINYLSWENVMWSRWTLKEKLKEEKILFNMVSQKIESSKRNLENVNVRLDIFVSKM